MRFIDLNKLKKNLDFVRAKLKNNSGTTLVEVLVSVLLMSLVGLICVAGLFFAYNSTTEVKQEAKAWEVADSILSRIEGELINTNLNDSLPFYMNQLTKADELGLVTEDGIPLDIYLNNKKYLEIHYNKTKSLDSTAESRWTFDEAMYSGYVIDKLEYTAFEKEETLVIQIHLSLKNSKSGKVFDNMDRTVCCFHTKRAAVSTDKTAWENYKTTAENE